jgi:hypothetical protein
VGSIQQRDCSGFSPDSLFILGLAGYLFNVWRRAEQNMCKIKVFIFEWQDILGGILKVEIVQTLNNLLSAP